MNAQVVPGVHPNVPYDEYAAWDAVNHSKLKPFERTALHARWKMLHEPDPTEAMEMGKACHLAVLEPERFESEFLVTPKVDKRSKAGKQRWAAFEVEAKGRSILTEEEYESIAVMAAAVHDHPLAGEIVKAKGATELSALWIDEKTGERCKARWDKFAKVIGYSSIIDLKSCQDASPKAFAKDIEKFDYASQGAFYIDGANTLSPMERRFILIAVEKNAPFAVAVYELEFDALEEGRKRYRRWLRMFAEAKKTNVWPGYDPGLLPISLPRWAMSNGGEE